MINIKDIEVKKLIIAYFVCRQKGSTGLKYIFRLWTQQWSNDFVADNGMKLRMHNQKIIVFKRKLNLGIPLPKCCEEYDLFLDKIYKWINEKYDNKVGRRTNIKMNKGIIRKNNDNINYLNLLTKNIVADIEKNFRVD